MAIVTAEAHQDNISFFSSSKEYVLPWNTSLNLIRKLLNQDFNSPEGYTIIIYYAGKPLRNDHLELFSVGNAIEHKKMGYDDRQLTVIYRFSPNTSNPYTVMDEYLLEIANDPFVFPKLYHHIDVEKNGYIFDLLTSLPQNKGISNDLFEGLLPHCLVDLLTVESPRKLKYVLKIVRNLFQVESNEENITKFKTSFILDGGLNYLISIIIALDFESMKDPLKVDAIIGSLISFIHFLVTEIGM